VKDLKIHGPGPFPTISKLKLPANLKASPPFNPDFQSNFNQLNFI
jgi:hypothetical protein